MHDRSAVKTVFTLQFGRFVAVIDFIGVRSAAILTLANFLAAKCASSEECALRSLSRHGSMNSWCVGNSAARHGPILFTPGGTMPLQCVLSPKANGLA